VSPIDPERRKLLRRCLESALRAVDGRRVVARALPALDLPAGSPVLALGKAAPAMLAGAADTLGDRMGAALCITRADAARPGEDGIAAARVLLGDHPVPGARSLAAGAALLSFIDTLPGDAPLLCLLSGGSSALAEVLPAGVDLAGLARANQWLLGSGLPIDATNHVRAGLSCLKAGRLAQRLAGRRVVVLAISDVPGDDPAVIGSGPWTASAPAPWPAGLPAWLLALLQHAPPRPVPGKVPLAAVDYRLVATGTQALRAAGEVARAAGLPVLLHEAPLQGEIPEIAAALLAKILAGPAGLHGWSGESTIRLPARPGRGGRNSHLALELACALAGRADVELLCAATDGSDGSGGAAGGWADGDVLARGAALGLDARAALARADSGSYLAATGDALVTGPTGTNVMDLVLALAPGDRGV
jgi:glycerate 2-kinase